MKRAALLLVALVLAVATPVLGQEIVLEMWDGITASDTEGIDALVAQFNEEYKGRIRVDRTATPWEELYDKVAVSVLAGTPPDIWIMHRENVPAHAMRNLLLPMDQYFEMAGLSDDDFLPGLADGGVYEGRRYGVPLDVHPLLLYYNENHLQEAGIPGPPANAEEHLDYARKLTRRFSEDQIRYGTRIEPWGWLSYTVLRQFGGAAYGGEGYRDVTIISDATMEALQYMYDLEHTYGVSGPSWIVDGNVSMHVSGIWWLSEIQRLRSQGVMNIQVAPGDRIFGSAQPAIFAGSHMFVFPRRPNPDPQKLMAAMEFIKWMGEHAAEWARYGQLPAWRAAAQSREFQSLEDHMKIAFQAFDFPPPVPWGQAHGFIEQMVAQVLSGEAAPGVAMEQAAHALTIYRDDIMREMQEAQGR